MAEEGKLYPEMPTKDLTKAAPELLEAREKKTKVDKTTSQTQTALQQSKELNALVIFEDGISEVVISDILLRLEQLGSLGVKIEMSTALVERMEKLNVEEMERSTIEDEIKGDEEVEAVDEYYANVLNERLAA